MRWQTIERGLNVALVLATLTAAGAFVVRGRAPARPHARPAPQDTVIPEWRDYLASGVVLAGDPSTAETVVVEFMDFECPFCKRFAEGPAQEAVEAGAALVLLHFPLPNHRFAKPAAVAFECAVEQGRAAEMSAALFAAQDLYGLQPWRAYAEGAGVPNLDAFDACAARSPESFSRIGQGWELAREIGARGTPTVIINGIRLASTATFLEALSEAMK